MCVQPTRRYLVALLPPRDSHQGGARWSTSPLAVGIMCGLGPAVAIGIDGGIREGILALGIWTVIAAVLDRCRAHFGLGTAAVLAGAAVLLSALVIILAVAN